MRSKMKDNMHLSKDKDLHFEIGTAQINKYGEELCGDTIITNNSPDKTAVILSDGLGSGVKANILSTLTTKIISVMLSKDCAIKDVLETLINTLPICQVRHLAYSTFSIVNLEKNNKLHLVNYDNPPIVFIRNSQVMEVPYNRHEYSGKMIDETEILIKDGDLLVLMSDGEVHAGICNSVNLDWDWQKIADFVRRLSLKPLTAQDIASELVNTASKLYAEQPGDDISVAVIKVREKRYATLLIGSPIDKSQDKEVVDRFMALPGSHIICGGTTSNIVSRETGIEIEVDITTLTDGIPPVGKMKGVSLCCEGIITISNALKLMQSNVSYKNLELHNNGASMLVQELLKADEILFMVGQSINPAHQTANMPMEFGLKTQISQQIAAHLSSLGKHINLEYY